MDTVLFDVMSALGEQESAPRVRDLLERLSAVERYDDPPFRHYLSASKNGMSFLFEDGRLIDVQVFVEATRSKAACPFSLPFGLQRGMKQPDVHQVLGAPDSSDSIDSRYSLNDYRARLLALYDATGVLKYLSLAPLESGL